MNYIINSKNRKLKYRMHLLFDRLSFNFLNFTGSQKITFIGVIIAFFSLFATWFSIDNEKTVSNTAFSINSGYVGYIIGLCCLILTFLLLSNKNKEKIKTKAHVFFHDYTIIIFVGIMSLVLTIVIFNLIRGFTKVYGNLMVGNGITFEIIGAFFIIFGGILNYREQKYEIMNRIYIENNKFEAKTDMEDYKDILGNGAGNNKNNMTLPI